MLPDAFATDPARLERFEKEALAVGQLNHPNVVTLHDVGTHEGAPFVVSELLDGLTLRARIESGPLAPAEARDHEPLIALDGGADGLGIQRRVIADAPAWLAPGGRLLVETSERQEPHTRAAVRAAGFAVRTAVCEDLGATVVTGARAQPS